MTYFPDPSLSSWDDAIYKTEGIRSDALVATYDFFDDPVWSSRSLLEKIRVEFALRMTNPLYHGLSQIVSDACKDASWDAARILHVE